MKQLGILIILLLGLTTAQAQQATQYSLYTFNTFGFNPAYAGLDYSISATGIYRQQWVDLAESPTTQALNVHMPFYLGRGGIGLSLENDELGAERTTSFSLAYNYQLAVGNGVLALGLSAGYLQRGLDGTRLRTPDGSYSDNILDHQDALLPTVNENSGTPTFDAGVYYQAEQLELGLSVRNLTEPAVSLSTIDLQTSRSLYFIFKYHLDINSSIRLHPSAWVRSDLTQTQTDVTLLAEYNDNIFGGASFRGYNSNSIDAVAIMGGFNIGQNIRLGYAYDLTLSDLNQVSNGSHELMLTYRLDKPVGQGRPPRIIYHPRAN